MQNKFILFSPKKKSKKVKVPKVISWDSYADPKRNIVNIVKNRRHFRQLIENKVNIIRIALHPRDPVVLAVVGLDARKEGGKQRRRKVTLHSLRRFTKSVITDQAGQDYSEWILGHAKSPYYTKKEPERREIYATKCMKYLTFLDYTTLEATGRSIEAKLSEKDREIAGLREKYDTDIALLKEAMADMQQLLKNPGRLAELSKGF